MPYNATFHGLHEWHKSMFEKLGWMVLAKDKMIHSKDASERKHMKSKIQCYINSVHRLCNALEEKIRIVEETDRKMDLVILLRNCQVLYDFVKKSFA